MKNVFEKYEYEYDYIFNWSNYLNDSREQSLFSSSSSPKKKDVQEKEICEQDEESNLTKNCSTLPKHKK